MAVEELPLGPLCEEALTARRATYPYSAFPKGSDPQKGNLLQTGSMRREPDLRRESAKTASPFEKKRATIRRRLPAVRGGQQAATGRRAGPADYAPRKARPGSLQQSLFPYHEAWG
jgi:hypothetical protein